MLIWDKKWWEISNRGWILLQMTEAVLFDNDGVLVDTETLFFEVTRQAFGRMGLELTRETWAARYLGEGHPSKEIALSLGGDPERVAVVLEERNRQYRGVLEQPPPIRPKVEETLARLHGRVKLAIVTGSDRRQFNLMHATSNLLSFFDLIITSDDCSYLKPHPGLYSTAITHLGVRAENCIAVEDSPRGLAAARAAGIPCVAVPTELTGMLDFPGALAVEGEVSAVLKYTTLPGPSS
jgi:HAD superfamily hydrolase (TIGR01509 family)